MNKVQRDLYRLTLEAISICKPTSTVIFNKLIKARTHTDDAELRRLIETLEASYRGASHVPTMPIKDMSRCRASAGALAGYCRRRLDEQ
ncbi:MAG: hypothetical protein JSR28_18810 [Proteobacteria bacterium]|nr:hypothetical protein [Pseudomonadota bacterium]